MLICFIQNAGFELSEEKKMIKKSAHFILTIR